MKTNIRGTEMGRERKRVVEVKFEEVSDDGTMVGLED